MIFLLVNIAKDQSFCHIYIDSPHCITAHVSLFSLGCGIGYGYLHRIPTLPFTEGKKISFPPQSPNELNPSPKDGFTEVAQRLQYLHPKGISLLWLTASEHLLRWSDVGHQVHLSAVVPTVPVAVSSSASTGLEQSLTGLTVSSNPTAASNSLQTGTPSFLGLWIDEADWTVIWVVGSETHEEILHFFDQTLPSQLSG